MEKVRLLLNDVAEYDKVIANSLPEGGDLRIITKDVGMESGRASALFCFTVQLPDGTKATAQAAVTVNTLQTLAAGLNGRYEDGLLRPHLRDRG